MWTLSPFAPELPAWRRLRYIEACHRLALCEWLISWAEWVESEWRDHFIRYPFASHEGTGALWVTLCMARETLNARMRGSDAGSVVAWVDHDIASLANTLASARGMPPRTIWCASSLDDLTYLNDLLKCDE